MSESNSYRKYHSPIGNIIPIGLLKNPIGLSIFPVGESILLWELSFSDGILIFKGKFFTCQVKHTKNKSGYILSDDGLSFGIHGFFRNCILSGCKNATLALA